MMVYGAGVDVVVPCRLTLITKRHRLSQKFGGIHDCVYICNHGEPEEKKNKASREQDESI